MTVSSRTRITIVRETTVGTTPTTPRMRTMRITKEGLTYAPDFVESEEIRSDRMNVDPILVMTSAAGSIDFELSYPVDESPMSEILRSAFWNPWTNTAQRDNDGTADSVITDVATTNTIVTCTTGTAFVAGQLVRFTNFTVAGNNGVFKCTTGSATLPRFVGSGITDEAAPPATARMKVVGFQGAAADITATSTGLGSTLLDFTTLGLAVGQWVKIGGTAAGDKFATSALNDWMRITAIAATALTLDNRPSGWTTDSGTGKTIKVWFGDQIKNSTTQTSLSIEKGFLGQTTPVYILSKGQTVDTFQCSLQSKQKINCSVTFKGMGGSESTTSVDASPDAATTNQVMAGNANVGRLAENGSQIISPNWAKMFDFTLGNGLRQSEAVDSTSPVAVKEGDFAATGKISCYFGDDTILAKFYAGTTTSFNARVAKNSQALIWQFPHVTLKGGGNPSATAKATDVYQDYDWSAGYDSTTSAAALLDRLEYYE